MARTPVMHELQLNTPCGKARLTLAQQGRVFEVCAFEVENRPELSLAFAPSGLGVENLDTDSDIAQCFNLSNKIRYQGVTLGNLEMKANSLEELAYALKNVKIRVFNHEEI